MWSHFILFCCVELCCIVLHCIALYLIYSHCDNDCWKRYSKWTATSIIYPYSEKIFYDLHRLSKYPIGKFGFPRCRSRSKQTQVFGLGQKPRLKMTWHSMNKIKIIWWHHTIQYQVFVYSKLKKKEKNSRITW